MAIDVMEEIILYEEKAKKIRENAKVFANQIYNEITEAAEANARKKEKEYKEKLTKEYEELKMQHTVFLNEYQDKTRNDANILLERLNKHKPFLAQTLARYILDKE